MRQKRPKIKFVWTKLESTTIHAASAAPAERASEDLLTLELDEQLSPRDEAIFLLHTAAEIEHALMVQYLAAGYSLGGPQVPEEHRRTVEQWRRSILQIAREEMGHLASVQNLLRLIDAPLNLEREDFPFRGEFYPFHFMIEPLTRKSLAKYVAAESPENVSGEGELLAKIREIAADDNMDLPVNRVGALFVKLRQLFGDTRVPAMGETLADSDFRGDPHCLVTERDWGFQNLIIKPSPPAESDGSPLATDPTGLRKACDGTTNIHRYQVSEANPDLADPNSVQTVLRIAQPQGNHNGGWIGFGPKDGFLYIATGDGGNGFDVGDGHNSAIGNAQDITNNLLGKILRIDVDGDDVPGAERNYAIPPSNPFVGTVGDDEIWAFGVRNPWRCSFDRQTGDLYIGDVGQFSWEEVNFQPASSTGGENYGWRLREGQVATPMIPGFNVGEPRPAGAVDPIHVYPTGTGPEEGQAVVGGYVYRGNDIPSLQGTYFFADHLGKIWSFRYDGTNKSDFRRRTAELTPDGQTLGRISSFAEDDAGELYVCSFRGVVLRLAARIP